MTNRKRRDAANRQTRARRRPDKAPPKTLWLYGVHPVVAALANPARRCLRLAATTTALAGLRERLAEGIERDGLTLTMATRDEIARLLGDGRESGREGSQDDDPTHQGLALEVAPLPRPDFDAVCRPQSAPLLLLIDRINDPRNLGAVIRAAAAFEAGAVIIPDRHAPHESGALAKAASGALEVLPLLRVANIARAIELLQRRGYWCLGLDGGAEQDLTPRGHDGPVALVLGAEGDGLRRLTRERCDTLLRLPISDAVESLNLATAAAVALYALNQVTP